MPSEKTLSDTFLSWRSRLARVVSRIVPPHDVEDVVQETYVRACEFSANAEIKSPGSFMARIARNLALDYVRRAEWRLTSRGDEKLETLLDDIEEPTAEPFRQVASAEEFSHFCEAVRQLPVQCRKVFVMKKVYGYSQRDIAQELDLSENVVEKLIALGIKQCALYMRQRQEAGGQSARPSSSHIPRLRKGGRR